MSAGKAICVILVRVQNLKKDCRIKYDNDIKTFLADFLILKQISAIKTRVH